MNVSYTQKPDIHKIFKKKKVKKGNKKFFFKHTIDSCKTLTAINSAAITIP